MLHSSGCLEVQAVVGGNLYFCSREKAPGSDRCAYHTSDGVPELVAQVISKLRSLPEPRRMYLVSELEQVLLETEDVHAY